MKRYTDIKGRMNFKKLLTGLKKGDAIAERQLYALLYEQLFKVPLAYCKDKDEATLVFNQSMLYIFNNIKAFCKQTDLIKWAHYIIKNDCIDQIRKNTVYNNKLSIIGLPEKPWMDNEAISNLEMTDLLNCVQQLENAFRLCFVLFELEGFTHKEIAQQLNINQNTSKWYLAEAKKKLRKLIEAKGIFYYTKTKLNF